MDHARFSEPDRTRSRRHVVRLYVDKPFIIQDTDLLSTVGYWRHFEPGFLGRAVTDQAVSRASDLYIVAPSNIPFEPDPLRYGGDVRELPDTYWISLLEEFSLPYVVLENSHPMLRVNEADTIVRELFDRDNRMWFDRDTQQGATT